MGGRARPWEASEAAANNASEGRELRAPRRARWARSAWGEQLATRASQTHFMYTSYTNTYHTHIVSDFLLYHFAGEMGRGRVEWSQLAQQGNNPWRGVCSTVCPHCVMGRCGAGRVAEM